MDKNTERRHSTKHPWYNKPRMEASSLITDPEPAFIARSDFDDDCSWAELLVAGVGFESGNG